MLFRSNPGYFPGWVKIIRKDGRELVFDQRWEMGTPQNPVDMDAVMTKFGNNLEKFYTKEQVEKLSNLLQNIEKLENMKPLMESLVVL